ncbi:PD-(D/E)XK nuclease-like domain-containing protein [Alienimonas sp. DA493]|uniref:PD-(D/E)XK nuclease-like domain-containing protein n=1 Tax=Alienimonas sp. DA493 TaxID=3373605 RepID=UPI0037543A15
MKDCPEPGVYKAVPYSDYAEWDALNISSLLWGLMGDGMTVNMRRLKAFLDGEIGHKSSDELRFGRAFHCQLLEPHLFTDEFVVLDLCEKKVNREQPDGSKKQEPCGNAAKYMTADGSPRCGLKGHKPPKAEELEDYVTPAEREMIRRMREAANEHPEVRAIHNRGGSEVCVVADMHGQRCKARLDKFVRSRDGAWIVDIKTIDPKKLHRDGWSKAIDSHNYHVKAAFYIDIVAAVLGRRPEFLWVACGKGEGFDAAPFAPHPTDILQGRGIYTELLSAYGAATATGKWPGAFPAGSTGGPEVIARPAYAISRLKTLYGA